VHPGVLSRSVHKDDSSPQGDRILIPCIDVDRWLEGELITGPWVGDQCSTLLLLLEIEDAITLLLVRSSWDIPPSPLYRRTTPAITATMSITLQRHLL